MKDTNFYGKSPLKVEPGMSLSDAVPDSSKKV